MSRERAVRGRGRSSEDAGRPEMRSTAPLGVTAWAGVQPINQLVVPPAVK